MSALSGQGKVYVGKRGPNGLPGVMRWLGNSPLFELGLEEDISERTESFTGNRLSYRRLTKGRKGSLKIGFDEFSRENLALMVAATITAVPAAGAPVANLALPNPIKAGESAMLGASNVSAVAIKDSSGAPKVLTADLNYKLDPFSGMVDILDLTPGGPYVLPLTADFQGGGVVKMGAFKEQTSEYYVRLDGINTDDGTRMVADVYRVRFSAAKALSLISDDLADFELEGSVLADTSRLVASPEGQFFGLTFPT
jgi:hypothetical protein